MATKREFIIKDLMVKDFVEYETNEICLEENEDTGKSVLILQLTSNENFSIKNVDKKKTQIQFFQDNKSKSMFKRVDHIIFEQLADNNWKLHLVEMKSSVGCEKWKEVKGKFRASYLLAKGIAAMLEMNIVDTCMYTTYEKVCFSLSETNTVQRRALVGEKPVKIEDEWSGKDFALYFGTRINFMHRPIQMKRNEKSVLVGEYNL